MSEKQTPELRVVPKNQLNHPLNIGLSGWKKILLEVNNQISKNYASIFAAGVAFYAFLAIFPSLVALISIYGLVINPDQLQSQLQQLGNIMPSQAYDILKTQINKLIETPSGSLSWGTIIGIILAIWSANKGTKSLFKGVDMAYDTENTRGFIKQNALTLLFTLGSIILLILSMALIVGFPAFIERFGLPDQIENLIGWTRWLLLAFVAVFFVSVLYKVAPFRPTPKSRWVLPGASLSTLLWLIASWGFSFYVSNFGSYGEMYGSLSAVVVLLMWLFLTSFIIILGAELNSEIEKYADDPDAVMD